MSERRATAAPAPAAPLHLLGGSAGAISCSASAAAAGLPPVRYPERKDETLALLRRLLPLAGEHDAPVNPYTFAVLYEYLTAANPRLCRAFDLAKVSSPRLTGEAMRYLFRTFVAEAYTAGTAAVGAGAVTAAGAAGPALADLQRTMLEAIEAATRSSASATASATADTLRDLLAGLGQVLAQPQREQQAQHAAQLATLQSELAGAQSALVRSQDEVVRLREQLVLSNVQARECPLTGVLNRRGFDERLEAVVLTPPADWRSHFVVLLELDNFQRVRDALGTAAGDRVLSMFGEILRSVPGESGASDLVGLACARFSGPEFAIIMPSAARDTAVEIVEFVRDSAQRLQLRNRATQQVEFKITVSAGLAALKPREDARAWLASADSALGKSKRDGRDRMTIG